MIKISDLNTGLPPIIHYPDGSVNIVLALHNIDTYYCETNTYLPAWGISNSVYYNLHPEQYVGWIELEHVEKPKFD